MESSSSGSSRAMEIVSARLPASESAVSATLSDKGHWSSRPTHKRVQANKPRAALEICADRAATFALQRIKASITWPASKFNTRYGKLAKLSHHQGLNTPTKRRSHHTFCLLTAISTQEGKGIHAGKRRCHHAFLDCELAELSRDPSNQPNKALGRAVRRCPRPVSHDLGRCCGRSAGAGRHWRLRTKQLAVSLRPPAQPACRQAIPGAGRHWHSRNAQPVVSQEFTPQRPSRHGGATVHVLPGGEVEADGVRDACP